VLVRPDDPAALAAAVIRVLDDPGLSARLGQAASARSASFPTPKDGVSAAVSIYAKLASGRS
jgi:glycosyltransferase involved in cell wall biosynthesis